MMYLMCLAGHCASVTEIDDPVWGVELNVTLLQEALGNASLVVEAEMAPEAPPPAPLRPLTLPAAGTEAGVTDAKPPDEEEEAAGEAEAVCAEEEGLLDLRVRDGGGGCGSDFIRNLGEVMAISGMLYGELTRLPREDESRQRCRALGRYARLEFDVIRWLDRSLARRSEQDSADLPRKLRKFYTEFATAMEIAGIHNGIAFCVPASCVGGRRADLARITLVYFSSLGAGGNMDGTEELQDPLWGQELNMTFPCGGAREQRSSGAKEAPAAERQGTGDWRGPPSAEQRRGLADVKEEDLVEGPCLEAWTKSFERLRGVSGAHANFGQDDNMGLFYAQEEECNNLVGGRYLAARFDLPGYLALDHGRLSHEADVLLQDLRTLYEANTQTAHDWDICGVGLCLPRSCLRDPPAAHRVALEQFVLLTGLDRTFLYALPQAPLGPVGPEDTRSESSGPLRLIPRFAGVLPASSLGPWQLWPELPPPKSLRKDSGASGLEEALWSAGAPCGKFAVEPSAEGGCGEDEVYVGPWGDCRCLPKARSAARASAESMVNLSDWPDCSAAGFAPEWRLLRETIQGAPGDPSLDPTVVSLSDALARRYEWRAVDWVSRGYQIVQTCTMSYVYIDDDPFPSHPFVPLNLFFLNETDPRWASSWAPWRQFCMSGYAAALYFRARALELRGLPKAAIEDLQFALKMLGPCKELDFLERRVWRVGSLDVETNLMRLRGRAQDGRPVFAHSERPRGWVHFRSFSETFPTKGRIARSYIWSALRQNTLYRRFFRSAAEQCSVEAASRAPYFALLAWPPVFSVFSTPQVFRIWPDAKMAFFYLGPWERNWEKCPECKEEMRQHIAREQAMLQDSVPMKRDKHHVGQLSIEIDWDNQETGNFGYSDLVLALRGTFQRSPGFGAASVLLCSGHLWFCTTARMVTEKPMLISDLANPNQGMPPDMKERWYVVAARSVLELRKPTLRTLLVRDELLRSVLPTKGCTHSMDAEMEKGEVDCYDGTWEIADFVPFAAMPSLYVRARWSGPPARRPGEARGPYLVMREGTAGKFSKTMRGQHFFTMFRHLAKASSLDVTFLITENIRVPYSDMATDYRAAVSFLGITNAKRTPHDLYMLEIPTFFPTKSLNAAALSSTGYYAASECDDGPWRRRSSRDAVPPLCSWVRTAFQLELSSFYRMPHLFLFESATDLAYRLGAAGDDELRRASAAMREFTRQRVEDDGRFWRDAILAMTCATPGAGSDEEMPAAAHSSSTDPRCLFGLPSADGEACCAIDCGTCEEAGCDELPPGREDCCPSHIADALAPCSEAAAPCALRGGVPPPTGGCEEDPRLCSSDVLQFSTHLDHRIAVARP